MMMHAMIALFAMFGATNTMAAAAQEPKHQTRRVQEESLPTAFCNSLGCPGGYIPIEDAGTTECPYGICTVAQCCDSFCWGFSCTVGIPNYEEINTLCPKEGCTADLCCTTPVLMCDSIGCPPGSIPIMDAQDTPCDDGVCTVEQCCDAFCWGIGCPAPLVPNPKTINDECSDVGCTPELCCTTV